ncbi:MAG: hypothetical protein ACQEQV_10670 [Fibrobacterota bacterium]
MTYDLISLGSTAAACTAAAMAALRGCKTALITGPHTLKDSLAEEISREPTLAGAFGRRDISAAVRQGRSLLQESFRTLSSRKLDTLFTGMALPLRYDELGRRRADTAFVKAYSCALADWVRACGVDVLPMEETPRLRRRDMLFVVECDQFTAGARAAIIGEQEILETECIRSFLKETGHSLRPGMPQLMPMESNTPLPDFSCQDARVFLWRDGRKAADFSGELIHTKGLFTGSAVRAAASFCAESDVPVEISCDFFPGEDEGFIKKEITEILDSPAANSSFRELFSPLFPRGLLDYIQQEVGLTDLKAVSRKKRTALLNFCKKFPLSLRVRQDLALHRSGGIATEEIHPGSLVSRMDPDLFFAGSALDTAFLPGGYALYASLATGYTAGRACSKQYNKGES